MIDFIILKFYKNFVTWQLHNVQYFKRYSSRQGKNLTKYKNIFWFPLVTFVINNT